MSPDRAERDIFEAILDVFFAKSGHCCGRGGSLRCRNLFLSPNIFTMGHIAKIERSVANVTPAGSPDRAECHIFKVVLDFLANSSHFWGWGATL